MTRGRHDTIDERMAAKAGPGIREIARAATTGALLCVAGSSAIAAQYLLVGRGDQTTGIAAYLVAATAFALSVWSARSLLSSPSSIESSSALHRLQSRSALAAGSAALMVATLMAENERPLYWLAILAWLGAMALAQTAAGIPLPQWARGSGWRTELRTRARWPEMAALFAIVVAGSVLRLYSLADFPSGIHGDESEFGLIARTVLSGDGPNPFGTAFFGDPALFVYLEAPFLALFGNGIAAVRSCAAVFGILTIPAFYLFLRSAFGACPALIGATLLAGNAASVHYSRLALNVPQGVFFGCMGIAALWLGYRSGKRSWWLAAGMLGGLTVYFHFAARLFPLVMALFTLYLMLAQRPRWRFWVSRAAMAALGGAMALAPMAWQLLSRSQEFTGHMTDRLIFSQWSHATGGMVTTAPALVLLNQLKINLLAFVSWSDSGFYGFAATPLLAPILGPLVVLGMVLPLLKLREPRYALLAIWFWVFVIIDGVITIDSPQSHRLLSAVLPAIAGASLVVEWLLEIGPRLAGTSAGPLLVAGAAAVTLSAAILDDANYFGPAAAARPWEATTAQAKYVAALGTNYVVYTMGIPGVFFSHGSTRFLAPGTAGDSLQNPAAGLPIPAPPDKELAFLVYPTMADYLPTLKSLYPYASQEPVLGRNNSVLFTAYTVDRAEASRGQGLLRRCDGTERLETDPGSLDQPACANPEQTEWTGSLFVNRPGRYRLAVEDRSVDIYLDGDRLPAGGRSLMPGWHTMSLRAQRGGSSSRMALKWQRDDESLRTVPVQYLQSQLLPANLRRVVTAADGQSEESRDRAIGFRVVGEVTTIRPPATFVWSGTLNLPVSGRYRFELNSDGNALLTIAGKPVISMNAQNTDLRNSVQALELPAGQQPFQVRYDWRNGAAGMIEALWAPPGSERSLIPPSAISRPQ